MTAQLESLAYGDEVIPYMVLRMGSRKTLGIEVHPDGRVLVRAPLHCEETLEVPWNPTKSGTAKACARTG